MVHQKKNLQRLPWKHRLLWDQTQRYETFAILLDIARSSQVRAQATLNLLKQNMLSIVNVSKVDTIHDREINSITRFVEKNNVAVIIQPSKTIQAKGCGRCGRPPKSSTRFRSIGEQAVDKIISNKNRKCRGCNTNHSQHSKLSKAILVPADAKSQAAVLVLVCKK